MRTLLLNEIKKEMPNSRALDALNTAIRIVKSGIKGNSIERQKVINDYNELRTIVEGQKLVKKSKRLSPEVLKIYKQRLGGIKAVYDKIK